MTATRTAPRHMPWAGGHTPFTIGLRSLDIANWIEVDVRLKSYLDQKEILLAADEAAVFAAEPETANSQREVLALLAKFLPERFPEVYRRAGALIEIVPAGRVVDAADVTAPPLLTAARLVQEDLIVLRQSDSGWRLAAASLSFPSTWSLREKFGRPLQEIHAPVPDFGPQTRNAMLIDRIFDNLKPEAPVWRANWSLYHDGELHHGESKKARYGGDGHRPGSEKYIRVEYQTLRKLPESGDILFTVRIHVDPIDFLKNHAERGRLAMALREAVCRLDPRQLAYKGLTGGSEALMDRLTELAKA
jgi:Haem-dependent oxidative N-demethylase, alpha subunit-like